MVKNTRRRSNKYEGIIEKSKVVTHGAGSIIIIKCKGYKMEKEIKFYDIETEYRPAHGRYYRYLSLVNGARGSWTSDMSEAKKQGENHELIIKTLYDKKSLFYPPTAPVSQ